MRAFMAVLLIGCGTYISLYAFRLEGSQPVLSAIGGFVAGSGIGSLLTCFYD